MQFSISCDSCVQQMNNSLQIRNVYSYHCYIKQLQYRPKRWHDMIIREKNKATQKHCAIAVELLHGMVAW